MNKELIDLYKSKPELIDEHRRLVQILRHGSDAEQKKEAERQLKELKEMLNKEELEKRCWEGYKPVPGKKPYEKGSCEPVSKEEDEVLKVEKNGQWSLGKSNSVKFVLRRPGKPDEKVSTYDSTANIQRKENRTGDVVEGVGANQAVHNYTGIWGTADKQAENTQKQDVKRSRKKVTTMNFANASQEVRQAFAEHVKAGKNPNDFKASGVESKTGNATAIKGVETKKKNKEKQSN